MGTRSKTQGSNAPYPRMGAAQPTARGCRAGAQWAEPRSSIAGKYSLFSLERTLFAVFFMSAISSSSSSFVSGEKEKSKHNVLDTWVKSAAQLQSAWRPEL